LKEKLLRSIYSHNLFFSTSPG